MVYFTADCHFDHANIIRFCDRPFSSVQEMNEVLIDNWNRKVTGNDTIYILGDLLYRSADPEAILKRLHGKKHLIIGNHDNSWMKKVDLNKYFLSTALMEETTDGRHILTLCHYPLFSWNHQSRSFMIHGHIHNDTDLDFWPLLLTRDNVLNAGMDINGFQPVTFDEMLYNNRMFKKLHS